MKQLRNRRSEIWELKEHFLSLACYAIINRKYYANVAEHVTTIGKLLIYLSYYQQNKEPVV